MIGWTRCVLRRGIHAERRFGDAVIPSHLTVGWRYRSAEYHRFFHAQIRPVQPARITTIGAAQFGRQSRRRSARVQVRWLP
jgi:pyruvate dehydrogenase complex dehydrogenase (E1) component